MVHKYQTRKTHHPDRLLLPEIKEGERYVLRYCFAPGRHPDRANKCEEAQVRVLVLEVRRDEVALQREDDNVILTLNLYELGIEPNKDGEYICHHRLTGL